MKSLIPAIVLIVFILAVDLYTFKGLKLLTSGFTQQWLKTGIHVGYWLVTASVIVAIFWLINNFKMIQDSHEYKVFFTLAGLMLLVVAPKLIFIAFHLLDDIYFLVMKLFSSPGSNDVAETGKTISRAKFLTQTGLVLAAIPFVGMIYGMVKGRFDFRILKNKLAFTNLPPAFNGLKIVHISDAHLGSFYNNYDSVSKGFEMINSLDADLIFFTGDLVNNYADEAEGWQPHFKNLKAKYGKYAILGNHDYGDYVPWENAEAKRKNLQRLVELESEMGFKTLLNQNDTIDINGQQISIIGVENWGKGGFSKYGDLAKAMNGSSSDFKILLSHDPSHWEEEILKHTNIDLTLSGHTHGMQFGIEIPGIKWSPVQYRYPRWGGLYTEGKQHLYVNRGFGYIGFPGRVGIAPEITLIELESTLT
jgi:predicted MPP superfamily phosphohydrolase